MSSNEDRFFKGLVFGALVAGIGALLFAPKSGKELRKDIQDRANTIRDDAEQKIHDLEDNIAKRTEKLKSAAKDLAGEARMESEGLIDRAEQLKDDLKVASSNIATTGKNAKDITVSEIKPLMSEGAEVMKELERLTRKLATSAKNKLSSEDSGEEEDQISRI